MTSRVLDPPPVAARWRLLLLWIIPLAAVAAAVSYMAAHARYVSTDNAYVKSQMSEVAPEVSGTISEVRVIENRPVKAGEVLLVINSRALRMTADDAAARVDLVRSALLTQLATQREKAAELAMAQRDAVFAVRELERQRALAAKGLVAVARLDDSERAVEAASGRIEVLERDLQRIETTLGHSSVGDLESHPAVRSARAAAAHAALDVEHTELVAPRAGMVSRLPQVGDHVTSGRPVLAIVDPDDLWLDANFKETDLEYVRPGQTVEVKVDTYSHRHWVGRVESIAQATGAEFAILPAQNATGNWVKVVQRVPVRIRVTRRADDPPLRAGMSAEVIIDTGDRPLRERFFGAR